MNKASSKINQFWKALDEKDRGMAGYYLAQSDINDWNQRTHSPLHHALLCPELHQCVPLFLSVGADLNAIDEEGRTPLMLATQAKLFQSVQFILNKNINILTQDIHQKTVMDYIGENNEDCRFLLEQVYLQQSLQKKETTKKLPRL